MTRDLVRKTASLIAVGLAALASTVLLATIVITLYAVQTRSPSEISRFALRAAEVWALGGAFLTTGTLTAYFARRRRRWLSAGIQFGATAAAFVTGAALWVRDLDVWTAAAWFVLPLAGAIGAWWTRYREERAPEELQAPAPSIARVSREHKPAARSKGP